MKGELYRILLKGLNILGIHEGDTILVHSSLGSLGKYENKAGIVVGVLLELLGENGTLLMPTLSYETVTEENPVFNLEETPSCVGGLTEYFRSLSNVKRSLHPTHSVCCMGKNTDYYIEGHCNDNTPCGENSPFRKLKDQRGKILFLGCSLNANTSMHGVEELSKPKYLFGKELEYTLKSINGETIKKKYITHNFKGFKQRYDRVLNILSEEDCTYGKILTADCYLINASPLWKKAHKQLCKDPMYFVEKTNIDL